MVNSNKKTNILVITWNYPPKVGGMEQLLYQLVQNINDIVSVMVLAPFTKDLENDGDKVSRSQRRGLWGYFWFAITTILTRLVSIAPGGLGVREGLAASIAAILGFDPVISVVAVGLDRLISTTLIIFLGIYFSSIFGRSVVLEEKSPDNLPRN